jgi:hypothetical protein
LPQARRRRSPRSAAGRISGNNGAPEGEREWLRSTAQGSTREDVDEKMFGRAAKRFIPQRNIFGLSTAGTRPAMMTSALKSDQTNGAPEEKAPA